VAAKADKKEPFEAVDRLATAAPTAPATAPAAPE
jgi:hypothetical protein